MAANVSEPGEITAKLIGPEITIKEAERVKGLESNSSLTAKRAVQERQHGAVLKFQRQEPPSPSSAAKESIVTDTRRKVS